MPKIVDHDERRREVLNATWRVIGRVGLEATTVRRIAQEAGFSNGALGHYFSNKEDILISAHRLAFSRARERIVAETEGLRGLAAIRSAMHEALPLDEERLLEAQVDVSFLGQTVGNPHLHTIRSASNRDVRQQWADFIDGAKELGEIPQDEDTGVLVDELMALIDSLSIEAIIDSERMTASHQVLLVERFLDRIAVPRG